MQSNQVKNDYTIWQSFKSGNEQSFLEIYEMSYARLYKYGYQIVPDSNIVKDAIHDLFVKIWSNRNNLRDVDAIVPYLLFSLRNTLYNQSFKEAKVKKTDIEEEELKCYVSGNGLETYFQHKEIHKSLSTIFGRLTPRQREIVHLYFIEEMNYDEIASYLGLTVKATYKLAARAIQAIRKSLTPEEKLHLRHILKFFLLFY